MRNACLSCGITGAALEQDLCEDCRTAPQRTYWHCSCTTHKPAASGACQRCGGVIDQPDVPPTATTKRNAAQQIRRQPR
jgi:hypothetical protein